MTVSYEALIARAKAGAKEHRDRIDFIVGKCPDDDYAQLEISTLEHQERLLLDLADRLEALASRPAVAEGAIGWIDQATLDHLLSAPKDQRTRIHVVGVAGEAGALICAAPKP